MDEPRKQERKARPEPVKVEVTVESATEEFFRRLLLPPPGPPDALDRFLTWAMRRR